MITVDLHELLRQLTPAPLRHSALLRSLLRAACSPLAALFEAQNDYEEDAAFRTANDGPLVRQLRASVSRISGMPLNLIAITDDVRHPPVSLWTDGDTATGHTPFPLYKDSSHTASLNGGGGTPTVISPGAGGTAQQDYVERINHIFSDRYSRVPYSFTVETTYRLTQDARLKVAAHIDLYKPINTTYRITP